jgi:hypothetical protein
VLSVIGVAIGVPGGAHDASGEGALAGFGDLAREYEAKRFPPTRRLDLHGEGPMAARERALHWIQSFAHEEPGAELLLIVERGRGARRDPTAVRVEVEKLLRKLEGRLIDWWQIFEQGSLALKISDEPRMHPFEAPAAPPPDDGRTPETAGAALVEVQNDIPGELLELAESAAELRRTREEISVGLIDVVLRRVWIEAQADAMRREVGFEDALRRILSEERKQLRDER